MYWSNDAFSVFGMDGYTEIYWRELLVLSLTNDILFVVKSKRVVADLANSQL